MGRRAKPAAIKQLEGNPGKRLIQESGIDALGEPFVAEHLMDDARGCIEVIKQSMPVRVYSALDSFLLAAFGTAWALHKRAALEISNPEFRWIVVNSKGSATQSPWIRMLNAQAALLASLGDRLGLDPKSRAALKLPSARQQKSKFDGLIGHLRPPPIGRVQ
jgi:phage terminase small subunit